MSIPNRSGEIGEAMRINHAALVSSGLFDKALQVALEADEAECSRDLQMWRLLESWIGIQISRDGEIQLTFVRDDELDASSNPLAEEIYDVRKEHAALVLPNADELMSIFDAKWDGEYHQYVRVTEFGMPIYPFNLRDLNLCDELVDRIKMLQPVQDIWSRPNSLGI